MASVLKFDVFSSAAEVSFWKELARRKINIYKLSDEPRDICGYYSAPARANIPARFSISAESFNVEESPHKASQSQHFGDAPAPGLLHNVNTKEDFKNLDKNALLQTTALKIWEDINSGAAMRDPNLLGRFALLTFADLKKHTFVYWFCFPALVTKEPFALSCPPSPLTVFLGAPARIELWRGIQTVRSDHTAATPCIVLLEASAASAPQWQDISTAAGKAPAPTGGLSVTGVRPLSDWDSLEPAEKERAAFAITDPCSRQEHPGWPLRNLLALIAVQCGLKEAIIICCKQVPQTALASAESEVASGAAPTAGNGCASVVLRVTLPNLSATPPDAKSEFDEIWDTEAAAAAAEKAGQPAPPPAPPAEPNVPVGGVTWPESMKAAVGWELNAKRRPGELAPSATMNPDPCNY
jgi:ubiquitin-like modifier-activating enzyme ATG7